MVLTTPSPKQHSSASRREEPRIEILELVESQVEGYRPLRVLDLSVSGLGVETVKPFEIGSVHRFRFTLRDGATATLSARAVHCDRRLTRDGSALYLTGFRFDPQPGDSTTSGALIDTLTSAISFDIP
jgi:hypothetical protein